MRRYAKFTLLAVILVASAFAGRTIYTSAEAAALGCPAIQECIDKGYVMDSCVTEPICYLVPPDGEYEWGLVKTRLTRFCLPPINMTCYVQAREENGRLVFWESHNVMQR